MWSVHTHAFNGVPNNNQQPTATQPTANSHAATRPRGHAATRPRGHTATQPHSHTATQPHSHTATQPHSHNNNSNNNNRRLSQACPLFLVRHLFCAMDPSWQPVTGAAQRRRGRRLRAAWRHEQQSIAQALATFTHHSSRGQRTARAGEWGSELKYTATIWKTPTSQAAGTQYFAMDVDEVPVAGSRPDRLNPGEIAGKNMVRPLFSPKKGFSV